MKMSALSEAVINPVPNPPPTNPASTTPPANPAVKGNPLSSARTSAANFGKRVGLAALSALGSRSAQGRLSIQAITNELVTRFIQFAKGRNISDKDMTDDYVYQYIEKYYGLDALKAAGGTAAGGTAPGGGGQGTSQGPAPTNPPGGNPGGVMQNAPTVTGGQTNYQQPNTQPQPAPATAPPAQPASTPPPAPATPPAPSVTPQSQPRRTPLQRLAASRRKTESHDPWWIMATLNTVLQTAQRGTSRLDEVCTTIRAIQRDPQANDRFPQLNQIAVESHDRLFDLMVYLVENQIKEKPDLLRVCRQFLPEAFVTRAGIWQIFRKLAEWMNEEGLASTTRTDKKGQQRVVGFNADNPEYGGGIGGNARFAQTQQQSGAQQQQQSGAQQSGAQQGTGPNLGSTVITPNALNQAIQQTAYLGITPQQQNNLANIVGRAGETVDAIFTAYGGKPPAPIAALLLFAAKG